MYARVAELVYAHGLEPCVRKGLRVRVSPLAPFDSLRSLMASQNLNCYFGFMKTKNLINFVISVVLTIALWLAVVYAVNQEPTVIINNKPIIVEIANTPTLRKVGLSNRERLEDNHGMLFLFDQKDSQIFWNQNMRFPTKVIWINNNEIIGISDLPINTGENTLVHSPLPVDMVLEITDKTFNDISIKNGDQINIKYAKKTKK